MPPVKTLKNDTDVAVPRAGETYVSEDGTVSQVLDDHIDANYEPTEEEVLEFADWIGMKLPQDSDFLWLAREGLKTPLPKEWKPCSTNDGEVYYFNFKTGESSWDHPMDSLFRRRFEEEKQKALKSGKTPTAATAAATGKGTAAGRSGAGGGAAAPSSSSSSTSHAIPQTRVIMTETGTIQRDSDGLTISTTTRPGGAEKGGGKTAKANTSGNSTTKPPATSGLTSPLTGAEARNSAPVSGIASPLGGSTSSLVAGAVGGSKPTATATAAAAAPRRIVSEAERVMEERVQRDLQQSLEAEKAKLADAHQGTLANLQQLHEKDVADLRSSDEARRATVNRQEDEERERRLQQTREKCEELYGDELRAMEREEETLKSRLQRMEAEAARAASGNTQRAQVEEQMQAALARQRTELENTARRQHDAAVAAEEAAHAAAMQRIARESQEKVSASQQAVQRAVDAAERTMALEAESQKKALEQQLQELERQLSQRASAAALTSAATAEAAEPSPSLSEELRRVAAAKAARLQAMDADFQKAKEAARSRGEAALAEVSKSVQQQQQQQLSPGALSGSPTSRPPSFSGDRPMSVMVQGGSRPSSATASVAYTQELNRIRMVCAKERQDRMAQLRTERDAAIAAVSVSPPSSAVAPGRSSNSQSRSEADAALLAPTTLEELKAAHTAELDQKKALYARLEEELKQQLESEAAAAASATTAEQQSALIAKAVDAEMALYTQEVLARHARMLLEGEAKREKMLADHQLAREAYERKKTEMEQRQAREEQEAKEAFIQEKVDAAVAAETARLEAEHASAVARLTARYDDEREAAKGEVDEEMDAYRQAEREKAAAAALAAAAAAAAATLDAANAATVASSTASPAASAPDTQKGSTAALEARHAEVSQQLQERVARVSALNAEAETEAAALGARRAAALAQEQRNQHQLQTLHSENAELARQVAAAESERDGARRSASAAATPPLAHTDPSAGAPLASTSPGAGDGHRLRSVHEAALRSIEEGFQAEQATLEAEAQAWRSKSQQLLRDHQQQQRLQANATSQGGLSTPRQQVLSHPASTVAPSAYDSAHRTPLLFQASPIAPTAALTSVQNTPVVTYPFRDAPWGQRAASPLPLQQHPAQPVLGMFSSAGVVPAGYAADGSGRADASLVSRSALRGVSQPGQDAPLSVQQRQASLLAAREAWQLQRARELQRGMLPPPNAAAPADPNTSAYGLSTLAQDARSVSALRPPPQPAADSQGQLSLVLSKLSSRLDSLTGQAAQLHGQRSRSGLVHSRSRDADWGREGEGRRPPSPQDRRRQSSASAKPRHGVVREAQARHHSSHSLPGRASINAPRESSFTAKWDSLLGSE